MKRTLAALLFAVAAMTGCEMRAETVVNDDGSGTFSFVFGVEPFLLNGITGLGDDGPLDMFRKELEGSGVPWKIKDFREPGLEGIRATLPFTSPEDLQNLMYDLGKANDGMLFGSGDNLDEGVRIARKEGGWSFDSAAFTPLGRTQQKVEGSGLEAAFSSFPQSEQLDKAFRFEYHVTLPGAPGPNNATEVSEADGKTTYLWRVGAYHSEKLVLRAATVPAGPRFPVVPAVGGFALLVVAAFLTRDRWMPARSGPPPVVLEGMPMVAAAASAGGATGPAPADAASAAPEAEPERDPGSVLTDDLF